MLSIRIRFIQSIGFAFVVGLLCLLLPVDSAIGQTVAMSGEYGSSDGRILKFPVNGVRVPCDPAQSARCISGELDLSGSIAADPLGAPSSGVGVDGAGVVIMPGGLDVGDPFTIPPGVFRQDARPEFTPIVNVGSGFAGFIVQLDTTLSYFIPSAARAVNPPASTRVFQADGWIAPGNGQTGRAAASTTPISAATQSIHAITLRYKAGLNAFGGTMAALQDGDAAQYVVRTRNTYGEMTAFMPWIGKFPLEDGVFGNANTEFGAGWEYTRMDARAAGFIRALGGVAPPCTVTLPPGPAGCGLITNFTGPTIGTLPPSTSTRFLYPWTTGTVEVLLTGTQGGFPADQLLTAMGYDSTSSTLSGGRIRNVGLVAGSYTLRNSIGGVQSGHQIVGLDMQFTPVPRSTTALAAGLGLLALLAGRAGDRDELASTRR